MTWHQKVLIAQKFEFGNFSIGLKKLKLHFQPGKITALLYVLHGLQVGRGNDAVQIICGELKVSDNMSGLHGNERREVTSPHQSSNITLTPGHSV